MMKVKLFLRCFALLFAVTFLSAGPITAQNMKSYSANSFEVKGFHIDLRIQVMKIDALKAFALKLSKSGINTIIMEYEATFPFEKHPLIPNRYAYTKEEISSFVSYCSNIGIDVIPLQQTFGHVEYILRHPRYKELREDNKDYSQVNPIKEDLDRKLFTDLISEMVALHPSKYFHIGADETRLLGKSKASKAKMDKYGVGRLYGDYVAMICDIVLKMGKTPLLWADIALKYPEALKLIPKGVVFVDWNYGWGMDKFGDHSKLMQSGFEIWGAPSLRSAPDNYNLTLWEKHFQNIHDFVPQARDLGYKGMVMTSWSTSGVYSYVNESGSDIVDLVAIRRVYPLTGFNILLEAYLKSLTIKEPLNISAFVEDYCLKTYGFNKQQSQQFWKALAAAPYQVSQGKVIGSSMSVAQLRDSIQNAADVFKELKPTKNKAEYAHYQLITDIRLQYLNYQVIESAVNEKTMTATSAAPYVKQLAHLVSEIKKVNKRYTKMNKDVFYKSELAIDNDLRLAKVDFLYKRLAKIR